MTLTMNGCCQCCWGLEGGDKCGRNEQNHILCAFVLDLPKKYVILSPETNDFKYHYQPTRRNLDYA